MKQKNIEKKLKLYEFFKKAKNAHELSDDEILESHMFIFHKQCLMKPKYEPERIVF